MEVEEVLSTVAAFEAAYTERKSFRDNSLDNFGHPALPRIAVHKVSNNDDDAHLVVVYSKHSIAVQVVVPRSKTGTEVRESVGTPVLPICLFSGFTEQEEPVEEYHFEWIDEDEAIESFLLVELEDLKICSKRDKDDVMNSRVFGIVFGTNRSRLLVSELNVRPNNNADAKIQWMVECASSHLGSNVLEVLPCDDGDVIDIIRRKNKTKTQDGNSGIMVPFQPSGGVSSIRCCHDMIVNALEPQTTYVWITYKDGNIVRMHHAALFPSVWATGSEKGVSVDELLGEHNHTALFRCRVRLEPGVEQTVAVVPLPKYHPSPLAPVSFAGIRDGKQDSCHEALVFGSSTSSFPTLCLYTSENHFWEPTTTKKPESLVADVTKALVGGVVGALRWATTSNSNNFDDPATAQESGGGGNKIQELPTRPFPSIWKMPVSLFPGPEFHDVPRVVEQCSVDPDGQYAALADGIGRVLLFDLSTKQIIRMWKGLREASCEWAKVKPVGITTDLNSTRRRSMTYLVVHSKQRRVVEVLPPRAGDRLASFQVSHDSRIVSCPYAVDAPKLGTTNFQTSRERCVYVLDSTLPGGPTTTLKRVQIETLLSQVQQNPKDDRGRSSSREATMHVHHLKQLLSAEKAMFASKDDVFAAFCKITSLQDLSSCLDLVAISTVLEDELLVDGSAFQKLALKYCSERLQKENQENGDVVSSGASMLSRKISYYSRLIKAYDLLREYESTAFMDAKTSSLPLSNFAKEALGWAEVYDDVVNHMDDKVSQSTLGTLTFAQFASSCIYPSDDSISKLPMRVYLSESTRKRQEILVFLFRPLLGWFSSGVVSSVFEALGIRDDSVYVLKCFGEWFLNLSRNEIRERCLNQAESPMSRFLRETIEREITRGTGKLDGMCALSLLCEESTDLVRAFMLATLAHEVQLHVSQNTGEVFWGSVTKRHSIVQQVDSICEDQESLLRKIRVCLLVSLRLYGRDLAPFPLSVKNIEKEKDFSVFKWVALDELQISEKHEEMVTLEKACAMSPHKVNPFNAIADEPNIFALFHASCRVFSSKSHDGVEAPLKTGSLLLFFPDYNHHEYLAAHRALLYALAWIKDPAQSYILHQCWTAMNSLPRRNDRLSVAFVVALDVWRRMIAPIYRARLFGFSDIPEIQEEYVAPLLESRAWLREFGKMALQILMLLLDCLGEGKQSGEPSDWGLLTVERDTLWPPPTVDHTLNSLEKRAHGIERTAVEMHMVVVCALLYSEDKRALTVCAPGLVECFQHSSLSSPVDIPSHGNHQESFLCEAVVSVAFEYNGGSLESFSLLTELEILGSKWGYDKKWLRTTFLVAMYELGKDNAVDGLMIAGGSQIIPQQLIVAGVNIVCRRLDRFLVNAKSTSGGETRNIMGLLDAELCEWIHERSESSKPLASSPVQTDTDVKATEILSIRLLSLGSSSNADAGIRARIHALSVLSGILARANESS